MGRVQRTGTCKYGDRCRFLHGVEDSRFTRDSSSSLAPAPPPPRRKQQPPKTNPTTKLDEICNNCKVHTLRCDAWVASSSCCTDWLAAAVGWRPEKFSFVLFGRKWHKFGFVGAIVFADLSGKCRYTAELCRRRHEPSGIVQANLVSAFRFGLLAAARHVRRRAPVCIGQASGSMPKVSQGSVSIRKSMLAAASHALNRAPRGCC